MQWVSGASDGSLAVWSQMKKRPVSVIKDAHAAPAATADGGAAAPDSDAASWVQSVAACQNSDLVVRTCTLHNFPARSCVCILCSWQNQKTLKTAHGTLLLLSLALPVSIE